MRSVKIQLKAAYFDCYCRCPLFKLLLGCERPCASKFVLTYKTIPLYHKKTVCQGLFQKNFYVEGESTRVRHGLYGGKEVKRDELARRGGGKVKCEKRVRRGGYYPPAKQPPTEANPSVEGKRFL